MRSPAWSFFNSALRSAPSSLVEPVSLARGSALLDADARLWPSGTCEAVCVALARCALSELERVGRGSPWDAFGLSGLVADLLDAGPYGIGEDTARLLVDTAEFRDRSAAGRARSVVERFPGGASWASSMLASAHLLGAARDRWDRSGFASALDETGVDALLLPLGWFGDGPERADCLEELGQFSGLQGKVLEAAVVLSGEWGEWDTLGSFLRSVCALSA